MAITDEASWASSLFLKDTCNSTRRYRVRENTQQEDTKLGRIEGRVRSSLITKYMADYRGSLGMFHQIINLPSDEVPIVYRFLILLSPPQPSTTCSFLAPSSGICSR